MSDISYIVVMGEERDQTIKDCVTRVLRVNGSTTLPEFKKALRKRLNYDPTEKVSQRDIEERGLPEIRRLYQGNVYQITNGKVHAANS